MVTQVFRIFLIAMFAVLIQSLFNISNSFALSKQMQYPLIIAVTPYLISKLPVLGTKNLMSSGAQPLVSLVFMVICTIVIQYVVKEIKGSSQMDFLSSYLKNNEPISIGSLQIQRDFIVILGVVLFGELLFQKLASKKKFNELEKVVLSALTKFHSKKLKA